MTSYTTMHFVDRARILTESWLEAANVVILLVRDSYHITPSADRRPLIT
jgi:hypothetical protein